MRLLTSSLTARPARIRRAAGFGTRTKRPSVRTGRLEKSSRQVTMPMHGSTHHHFLTGHFVEEDMLLERTKDDKESPVAKTRVRKAAARSQQRMLSKEPASGFHGFKIAIRKLPAGVDHVPFKLPFKIAMNSSDLRRFMKRRRPCAPALVAEWPRNRLASAVSRIGPPLPATKPPTPA